MPFNPAQFPAPASCDTASFSGLLSEEARALAHAIARAGGRAVVVGGFVRDALLGLSPGDMDLEVYGLAPESLEKLVGETLSVRQVGKSFGILKAGHVDVSLPRSGRAPGRDGFLSGDSEMSLHAAAHRRDFTINAMAWDPLSGALYDPFHGIDHLRLHCLEVVDEATFREDPLRVLRAMQFVARFDVEPSSETLRICRDLAPLLPTLPRERHLEEVRKLLLKGHRIGHGLEVAEKMGVLRLLWPELQALVACPQDREWHPEGDVFVHTGLALDAAARERTGDDWEDFVVMLGVLCHDLGKPSTTVLCEDGHIRSIRHDVEGEAPTLAFLERLTHEHRLIQAVVPLVVHHLRPVSLYDAKASAAAIRRLATRVSIERLIRVARADYLGRTNAAALEGAFPAGDWLLAQAKALAVSRGRPDPLVLGRHLLSLGMESGKALKPILDALYDAQLEGAFADTHSGLEWAKAKGLLPPQIWPGLASANHDSA